MVQQVNLSFKPKEIITGNSTNIQSEHVLLAHLCECYSESNLSSRKPAENDTKLKLNKNEHSC